MENKKTIYLDYLRVFSMICVIILHLFSGFIINTNFSKSSSILIITFGSMVRFVVPIFIMISGACLLNYKNNINFRYILKKNEKFLFLIIFWTLLYSLFYFCKKIITHEEIELIYSIWQGINGIPCYHLYYLYIIIGIYLISPFIKTWLSSIKKMELEIFILISFILTIILPFICIVFDLQKLNIILNKFYFDIYGKYTLYFILGYYLSKYEINIKKISIIGFLALMFNIIITYLVSHQTGIYFELMQDRLSPTVVLISVTVFSLFKHINFNNISKVIVILKNYSLGIYLLHVLIIFVFEFFGIIKYETVYLFLVPLYTFLVLLLSLIISVVISKIPIIKHII